MKLVFISTSMATVYFVFRKFRATYEAAHDTFHLAVALVPAALLALLWHYHLDFIEASSSLRRLPPVSHT